ncbi:MAG: hypothetical protein V2I82_11855 [Halieaceae bacterium]|nr:hypothetical protein [Halieaceae bacterium]
MALDDCGGGIMPPAPSSAWREIPTASRGHNTLNVVAYLPADRDRGLFFGRIINCESFTEATSLFVILARPGVYDVEEQLPPVEFIDIDGAQRSHIFDFRVTYADGVREAIAVKPASLVEKYRFDATLARIAAATPRSFADRVSLVTDTSIDPIEAHNARMIHGFRRPDAEADSKARDIVLGLLGSVSIADLVAAIGMGARGLRACVRLIGSHVLELAARERITPAARVRLVGDAR